MLVEFQVSNFGLYKEPASLNMRSSREQRFRERVPRIESRYRMSVNPVAAIYGANASGKSSLLDALTTLRRTIVTPMSTEWQRNITFALDADMRKEPTLFKLVFTMGDVMYSYFLAIQGGSIKEEYLAALTATDETALFERYDNDITLGRDWQSDELLAQLARTVQKNIPFAARLADVLEGNARYAELRAVHDFLSSIVVITATMDQLIIPDFYRNLDLDEVLEVLDTGVTRLNFTKLNAASWPFTQAELAKLTPSDETVINQHKDGKLYSISKNDEDDFEVHLVRFCHQGEDGNEYLLNWGQESQGTRKILALLPWLWFATNTSNHPPILVVDELDHSLHTQLAKTLIEGFLNACTNQSRAQLIFTAHDLLLMDLDYLRRDEIWITNKNSDGAAELIGLPEYKGIRSDKDIRKSYLEGRFGGVPKLGAITLTQ